MKPPIQDIYDHQGNRYKCVPICRKDGCDNFCHRSGTDQKTGEPQYRTICYEHHTEKNNYKQGAYKKYKKGFCENEDGRLGYKCHYTIITNEQLHVDHIDGDHSNNDPSNLQTLCSNCHIVKTIMEIRGRLQPVKNEMQYIEDIRYRAESTLINWSSVSKGTPSKSVFYELIEENILEK